MAIFEEDLEYLSERGEKPYYNMAMSFYSKCIQKALKKLEEEFDCFDANKVQIYIQGSYQNNTMVDNYSKLEIVVEFAQDSFGELAKLPVIKTKKLLINNNLIKKRIIKFKPNVPLFYIKRVIFDTVVEESGNENIFNNNKSISIPEHKNLNIKCEILPAYTMSNKNNEESCIIFDSSIDRYVLAFPKSHCNNLQIKDVETNGVFIPVVRIFRNIRDILINNNVIMEGYAPSYFLECLLYNIPNELFTSNLNSIIIKILNYLKNCNLNSFICAHKQFQMFGNNTDTWTPQKARTFINLVIELWLAYDESEYEEA